MVDRQIRKWWRSAVALPKPDRAATASIVASVSSSSSWASRIRWLVSQRCGVVPVSWTNRRANVRGDIAARRARSSTVTGSSRCRTSQLITSLRVSTSKPATGRSTYWAWPPSRCGGTTIRRAIALATLLPCSLRTRYRQASMPAAVPALVNTGSSSTYSTSGSTLAAGNSRASVSVWCQCVVQRRSSSRPAAPRTNAPLQTLSTRAPRSTPRRSSASSGAGSCDGRATRGPLRAGTAIRSAAASRSSPCGVDRVKPWLVRSGPGSPATTAKS